VTSPDSELIARVIAFDDHDAFGELVRRNQSSVRTFLRHLTKGDHALADDLAQETFVQAYRGLARFRGDASWTTWLLGIAHNQWRNASRRRTFTPLDHETPEMDVPSFASSSDLRHDLNGAIRTLAPDERLALHVCYQQGLTHEEAATLLDWPLGTVKTTLARSKEKLRSLLAAWNPQT
jgi:RNA polymerase sigma factor (sigma-70 family)